VYLIKTDLNKLFINRTASPPTDTWSTFHVRFHLMHDYCSSQFDFFFIISYGRWDIHVRDELGSIVRGKQHWAYTVVVA
jgi:hypothetical protein